MTKAAMKKIMFVFVTLLIVPCLAQTAETLRLQSDTLRMELNRAGEITALKDMRSGKDYLSHTKKSYLIQYRQNDNEDNRSPQSMRIIESEGEKHRVELNYTGGIVIAVDIEEKKSHIRMEVVDAKPVDKISLINWGPVNTTMIGGVGRVINICRSAEFSFGMLSLEINTDNMKFTSEFDIDGSWLELTSYDRTRVRYWKNYSSSTPVPVTVIGSAVAFYGSPKGYDQELNTIETIVLEEKLPYPTVDGVWAKKSPQVRRLFLWTDVQESNADKGIAIAKKMGAVGIVKFHSEACNWGTFDLDTKLWPGGTKALADFGEKARDAGIRLAMYTLTSFIKPHPDREPYLAPIPDARLQTLDLKTALASNIDKDAKEITLVVTENLDQKQLDKKIKDVTKRMKFKVVRVEDELIETKTLHVDGNKLVLTKCERGAYFTTPDSHKTDASGTLMLLNQYHNFYPGTVEMDAEIAGNIARFIKNANMGWFVLDGYESCLRTGHGAYGLNNFMRTICDKDPEYFVSVSPGGRTHYNWHYIDYCSFGEKARHMGFRGTQLDRRMGWQVSNKENLVPTKLGQYYPEDATIEDIDWLMGLAAGWDSGVDMHFTIEGFMAHPEFEAITARIRLWEDASLEGIFTEEQKLQMRQTDNVHTLSRNPNGEWDLKFVKRWQYDKVKILSPDAITVKPANKNTDSISSACSIDLSWTHNPGVYEDACLSRDLIHNSGKKKTS